MLHSPLATVGEGGGVILSRVRSYSVITLSLRLDPERSLWYRQQLTKPNQCRVRKKWQPANRVGGEHLGYKEQNGEHLEVIQQTNNGKAKNKFKGNLSIKVLI